MPDFTVMVITAEKQSILDGRTQVGGFWARLGSIFKRAVRSLVSAGCSDPDP